MMKIYKNSDNTVKYESPMLVEIAFETEGILCSSPIDGDIEENEDGGSINGLDFGF